MLNTYGKKITFIIFLFILLLWMSGCGVNYHLKKADKHLKMAIAKGADVNEIKKVKHDTVKIESVRDSLIIDHKVDTFKVEKECEELVNAKPEDKPKIIQELKEELCPKLVVDTTYNAVIKTAEGDYTVPISIKINSINGYYAIQTGEIKIPYKKEETNLTIKPKSNTWRTVAIILALLLAATIYLITRMR